MEQSPNLDTDRVIPLVNKSPAKKPIKVYRKQIEVGPKTLKVLRPDKTKAPRKSVPTELSSQDGEIVVYLSVLSKGQHLHTRSNFNRLKI